MQTAAVFTVTEIEMTLTDNPASRAQEWVRATWTLGADSRADALRIVKQTIGERDLSLLRNEHGVFGFEEYGSRWRDLDGFKCDESRQWRVAAQ